MTGICPTGGHTNNILRYEDLETGGTCAKTFECDNDLLDQVLDMKYDIGVKVPPDIEGDISELQAMADEDHIVARVLVTKTAEGLYDGHAAHNLVLANDGGDLYPTHIPAGVVLGNVAQGDAQLDVSGGALRVQTPLLIRLCSEVHDERYARALTVGGGGC